MRIRRILLATSLGGLVVSAAHRVTAATGEAEAAVYGGETAGQWTCGPRANVLYGGVGAHVRVAERDPAGLEGSGFHGAVGGAAEDQTVSITEVHCATQPCKPSDSVAPPESILLGGNARGGWEGRYFAITAGAGMYQAFAANTSRSPSLAGYPQLELRGGAPVRDVAVHAVTGIGSPLVTTIQRPGLYGGIEVRTATGYRFDVLGGLYRSGPAPLDAVAPRADVAARFPILRHLSLRAGGSIGGESGFEGSGGLVVGL